MGSAVRHQRRAAAHETAGIRANCQHRVDRWRDQRSASCALQHGKFALVGLSEGLCAELARENIFVTTVCPGLMRTGSPRNATFKGQHRKEYAWFSISGSMPLLSISSPRAAAQIVRACRRGQPYLAVSLPSKAAIRLHAMAPA